MNSFKHLLLLAAVMLAGCTLSSNIPVTVIVLEPTATPTTLATPTAEPTPTETPFPYPWTDENLTMSGICFEAAFDAADQVFVLRSAEDHIRFYDGVDNSGLCRRPIERNPFEFDDGARTLAGIWTVGAGCDSRYEVTDYVESDGTLRVALRYVTEGECPYELVEPFWIGVDGVTNVEITVERAS